MKFTTLSPRKRAHQLILDAIATGVRGDLLDTLKEAERLAAPSGTSRALTQLHYDRLQQGQKLLDPDRSGLLMRNGARNGKVWLFRYSHPATGKQIEHQFGRYPEMSVSEARDRWAELRALRNRGRDPATLDRSKTDLSLTVADLVEAYLSDYAREKKRSHKTDERLLRSHLVPAYGDQLARDFSHEVAAELLHRVHESSGPREAEKLRACISTMFNFASGRTRKVLVKTPMLSPTLPNPVAAVVLPKHKAKNYKPTVKELASYAEALEQGRIPYADVLRLQLLAMCRISEAAQATWAEIDFTRGRWTIPGERTKNGHEHVILLSAQACGLLKRIRTSTASDYVFPSRRDKAKPMDAQLAQKALAKHRQVLGVSDRFTSHAALTWAAEEGCPRDVRDRLTNHIAGGGVDAIYNAAELNQPAKAWWQQWADYLDGLAIENLTAINHQE